MHLSIRLRVLKLGLPKGSLQEATVRMFRRAGFEISTTERSYFPSIDDPEISLVFLRAQEMSRYVESGVLDCGITGQDWILENHSRVHVVSQLTYSKQTRNPVRWVLAAPQDSSIRSVKDLQGKRIATELVNVTRQYLKKKGVKAEIEFSWGATEAKVATGLVDAVVELTETGSSLKANKLKEITTICESTTLLIANHASWKESWKKAKMRQLSMLLVGAITAEGKVGLKMNAPQRSLSRVIAILPALKKPTVSPLSQEGWYALETIMDEKVVRDIIPRLKQAGAQGIIEYPLNKIIQ
jgi:ATP phosphoribosyltransferase